ncbi:MAG: TolC family protein [Planctomycetales bacterium]|nr:TolC family protein [Planctomycetales bacterium]
MTAPICRGLAGCAVVLVLLLVGCQTRRTCCPQPVGLSEQWLEPDATSDNEQLAAWWTTLESPVLDQLVSHAASGNLDLREASWRIAETRARRRAAVGKYQPQGDWKALRHDRRQSQSGNSILPAGVGTAFESWSVGIDAAWEVGLFRRLEHLNDAATAKQCAAVEERRQVLVVLLAEVADEYVHCRTLQQQLHVARENLGWQRTNTEVASTRHESGLTSELDVAQASSQQQLTEAGIPLLEAELQAAVNRIFLLIGLPPAGSAEDLLGPGRIPRVPSHLSVGMPADLLRRRPDVRQAQQEAIAESALLGLAEAELLPHLSLTGTISLDSRSFSSLFNARSLAYTLGPTLRWNLLNRGRVQAEIDAQFARWQQALVAYERSVIAAAEEAETALSSFARQRQRVELLTAARQEAGRAAKLSRTQYGNGLVSIQAVLDAHQRKLEADNLLKLAEGEAVRQVIRAYRAAGGGWEQPPPPTATDELELSELRLVSEGLPADDGQAN